MNKFSNFLDRVSSPFISISNWLLRLSLGIAFILHSYEKFPLPPERLTSGFEFWSIPFPEVISSLVALGELISGIGIIVGGFISSSLGNVITRLSGGAMVVIMIGAFSLAHRDWFVSGKIFTTEQFFLFVLGLFFMIKGNK
jgi:putative oxidoreductase